MTETRAPYDVQPTLSRQPRHIALHQSGFAYLPDESPCRPRDYVRHPLTELDIHTTHGHRVVPDGHIQIDMGEFGMLELSPRDARAMAVVLLEVT